MFRRKKKPETLRVLDPRTPPRTGRSARASKPACLAIYLSAEGPLHLIDWNEEAPGFFVAELETRNDERVRQNLSGPHIYSAGSHTRCGCGFNYGRVPEFERDAEALSHKFQTMAAFSDYLAQEIGRVGEIELFCCRDGDQDAAPELHRELTPSALLGERFFFYENELSIVREDAA